ncbi:MAG: hypothetical protein GF355_07675 [Candidatus Eisenbacteria bacterium]|nr:hypothetical protein [Candidatus Eisenbacteria bacterium]
MRIGMKCFVLALLALTAASAASGEIHRIPVSELNSGITLMEQSPHRLVFEIHVGELAAMDVETPEGTFSRLMLPGYYSSQAIGRPELPMLNRLFEIPYGADVEVEVLGYEAQTYALADHGIVHPLMPAQPSVFKNQDPASLPFHYEASAYTGEVSYETARAVDCGRMRAVRIGRLETAPVSYDPAAGAITIRQNLRVEVTFSGGNAAAETELKQRTASPFFEALYRRLAGYRSPHDENPNLFADAASYVIVSDRMFESQLQPFIQWKIEQGFNVVVGYTDVIGGSTSAIQSWVHDQYNVLVPAPSFVLFVGDVAQIPAYNLSGYSDLPYCDVTGDDIPEMYYGRFSANNAGELQPYIDKSLEYERYEMPDPSYLGEAVMIAGVDSYWAPTHANGQINYATNHYFNLAHGILSHTYLYPESGSSDAQIIQDVSNGCTVVNYTAHGSQTSWSNPSFTMNDVANLENYNQYCLAIGNCCLTSSFQITTCFAEQWLRQTDKAGIGYIGGSESTLWNEDYYWSVGYGPVVGSGAEYEQTGLGMYDGMFHDHGEAMTQWYTVMDAQIFCGNLGVVESGSGYISYYWEIYNLMGDPSLSVYLGVPDENAVILPPSILPGATEVEVTAEPGSYVGFTGDGVLLGGGMVGASGTAMIPISGQQDYTNVHVVVTCQNKIPYVTDVPVGTLQGPYLIVDHNVIIDDEAGDGDGAVDAGESIDLVTYLRNIGGDPATNVTGVLSEVRDVTINDDTETWGTIGSEETDPCDDSFKFVVSADTPDQTEIGFLLDITSDEDAWQRDFSFIVEAPVLSFMSCSVDDTGGDGDGLADPGETVDLTVCLTNSGHEDAFIPEAVLSSTSDFVQINQGVVYAETIPEGGEGFLNGFNITIDAGCPEMSSVELHLEIETNLGYTAAFDWPLPVAPFVDDFQTDLGWTVSTTASTGAWERADPQGTEQGGQPLQPEDDHTPAPGTHCYVTGPLAGGGGGDYDVDDGSTILTSPAFNLSSQSGAIVEYWRWYTNDLGNAPGQDWWSVEVSSNGGTSWVYLEHTQSSHNAWQKMSFALEDYIDLTDQVVLRFTAADEGSGSLVEAAVDDVMLYGTAPTSSGVPGETSRTSRFWLSQNVPNVAHPLTNIAYRLDSERPVATTLRVYDLSGRLVRTLVSAKQGAGEYRVAWNGTTDAGRPVSSGVFFYVLQSGDRQMTRKLVLMR